MHLIEPGFMNSNLLKIKKEYTKLKNQKIHDIFLKTNYIKIVFKLTWIMEILKIELEEQLLIKYYGTKHFILLTMKNIINIKEVLRQWLNKVFYKRKAAGGPVKSKITSNK